MDTVHHSSMHSRAQLHQFLLWTAIATFLTAIIYIVAGVTILMVQMLMMAAGAAVLFIVLLLALWLNNRAQTTHAVYLTCSTIALYAVLTALIFQKCSLCWHLHPFLSPQLRYHTSIRACCAC